MGRSQQTFGKKEKEKKKAEKKLAKQRRKEERRENATKPESLEDMMVYLDADGNFTDTPPDPNDKVEIQLENIEISIPKGNRSASINSTKSGKVEFFNHEKGYGFIREKDTGEKYFVHIHGCNEEIKEHDKVTFDLEQGQKGMNAVNVNKIPL